MVNYNVIATQFGELIKYDTTIKEVNRIFMSICSFSCGLYPNSKITSSRSQTVYNWVMTISNSNLEENVKVGIIIEAIKLLVVKEGVKLKLLSMVPRDLFDESPLEIKSKGRTYVHKERIQALEEIKSGSFDYSKLIQFCKELNIAFSNQSYLSVILLLRGIIDHVPPLFGQSDFSHVANNYGTKSFKESMLNLNNSSRKIADAYLHTQIRRKESLPNSNQIDFSNDLDALLGEILRIV